MRANVACTQTSVFPFNSISLISLLQRRFSLSQVTLGNVTTVILLHLVYSNFSILKLARRYD